MEFLQTYIDEIREYDFTLFKLGETQLTLFTLIHIVVLVLVLVWFTRRITSFMDRRLQKRPHFDVGTRWAVVSLVRYALLIIGTIVILQTFGIKLTAFTVLAGAVGVGVGFGLQQIISNFISGLIIMFERPITVGDRIELGNIEGTVHHIGMRCTTIVTSDDIAVLVPNSRFITENVINLRYHAHRIRVRIPVNVTAASDAHRVETLLCEVAEAHPDVLDDPGPHARLSALQAGGNMGFELQVWNTSRIDDRDALVSELNFAIRERLLANEVHLA